MPLKLSPQVTFWLGLAMVGGFVVWNYLIKPILNQGQPIDPPESVDSLENIDSFF